MIFFFYLYLSDEQVNKLKLITSYFIKIKGKIDTLLITTASRNCRNKALSLHYCPGFIPQPKLF